MPGVDRVTTASSGEEVLRRWTADRFDLVLMDVRMPGLGGVETVRRLLSTDPNARVIMLTMAEDLDGVALAVASGRPRLPAQGRLARRAARHRHPGPGRPDLAAGPAPAAPGRDRRRPRR